jgi:hypothetical protein
MVSAKMIAKIRHRTLLALAAELCAGAVAWGGISAPARFRDALGRAMVRTSFIIFVETAAPLPGDACEHYRRLGDNRLIKT